MSIQMMLLGVGAVATKTYVDDVFSTYLYTGNNTARSINTGVDMTEGGLVWIKCRNNARANTLFDTARGVNKYLLSDHNHAENSTHSDLLTAFNNNGFSLGADANSDNVNRNTYTQTSWSFRKAPGFFDVVTYTGNGSSNHQISHNLGSVPGCIMVKCTSESQDWMVYHVGTTDSAGPGGAYLKLNTNAAQWGSSGGFYNTTATSTVFTLGDADIGNKNNATYVAYLFAGGESTAATARSVDFDETGDYLTVGSSADFTMGTGDFTIECWVKFSSAPTNTGIFQISSTAGGLTDSSFGDTLTVWSGGGNDSTFRNTASGSNIDSSHTSASGQFYHVALVRASSVTKLYINGTQVSSASDTTNYDGTYIAIGGYYSTDYLLDGLISNFRVVKGTAVYTSSFRPPTEPLTNITNTKLLCCNNSSTTGSTVTPGTITANGDPTASTDSPFDDPAAHVFGESGSESLISCGSYIGNGNADGPEIFLGWQPSYLLIKSATESGENWAIFDSMRGIVYGGDDKYLYANSTGTENTYNVIELTPTGFKCDRDDGTTNRDGETFIYVAIRRSDGYVGKPYGAGEGTSVFAIDYGSGSTTIPTFDSTFPVDFTMLTKSDDTGNRFATTRLIQGSKVNLDQNNAATTFNYGMFDSNVGSITHEGDGGSTGSTAYIGFQWKRHAGFDVTMDKGTGAAKSISHSLAKVPEMMIRKSTSNAHGWVVYHKGLNGGTTPQNYWIQLASTDVEAEATNTWNDTAPTSTHFTVGDGQWVSDSGATFMTLLFASVSGVSSVGYYEGNASASGQSITLGFQPRLLFIVGANISDQRWLFDSTTGFNTAFKLNSNAVPSTAVNGMISATSTGFDLNGTDFNGNNQEFIYYAHA